MGGKMTPNGWKPRMSSSTKKRVRRRLMLEQGGRCHYCGVPMTGDQHDHYDQFAPTIEHIIPHPFRNGSGPESGPIVLACRGCNEGWATKVDAWICNTFAPAIVRGAA